MITNCVDGARCSFQRPDCRTFSRARAANTGSCGASFLTLVGSEWRRQVRLDHPMSPSPAPRVATHQRSGSSIARNRRLSCLLRQGFLVLTLAGPGQNGVSRIVQPGQTKQPARVAGSPPSTSPLCSPKFGLKSGTQPRAGTSSHRTRLYGVSSK